MVDIEVSAHKTCSKLAVAVYFLDENYYVLFTTFTERLGHGNVSLAPGDVLRCSLTPNGTLLVTRPDYQIPKLFATTREMFDRLRLGSPADHLAFKDVTEPFRHTNFLDGFLLQKSPLRREEVDLMAKRLGIGQDETWGDSGPPEIYYSPFAAPRNEYEALLVDVAKAPDLERIYASSRDLLRPATDDKPFFNQRRRWSSLRLGFRGVLGVGVQGNPDEPVAEVTLVVLLIQAVAVAGVMILLPLVGFSRQGLRVTRRSTFLIYFAALGFGFILIEIVLLQRFHCFSGNRFTPLLSSWLVY